MMMISMIKVDPNKFLSIKIVHENNYIHIAINVKNYESTTSKEA